jgi:hypothetical protein
MPTGRHKKMKGGLGEEPGFFDSLTQGATDLWDKTKKVTTDIYSSATGSPSYTPPPTTSYAQPATPSYTPTNSTSGYMGGKNKGRKRSRKMRGGYSDNIADTGLAATAASISDIKSAEPLNIVGGKRRTKKCRRHRNAKSCKRRRH